MTELLSHEQTHAERIAGAIKNGLAVAEELSGITPLTFPGIPPEIVEELVAVDEQYPGLSTPTLTIIGRMKTEGMKVSFGDHPKSGVIFVVPYLSGNVEDDSLPPRHLVIPSGMDPRLRKLIRLNRLGFALSNPGIKETKLSE